MDPASPPSCGQPFHNRWVLAFFRGGGGEGLLVPRSWLNPVSPRFSLFSISSPRPDLPQERDPVRPRGSSSSRSKRHESPSGSRQQGRCSNSSPRHHKQHQSHRTYQRACWGCGAHVPEDKSLCEPCFAHAAGERGQKDQRLESLVKRIVQQSLKEWGTVPPLGPTTSSSPGEVQEDQGPSQPSITSAKSSDSDSEEEGAVGGFEFALVSPLIRAIKEALRWEDPVSPQKKQRKFFKHLGKERINFPSLSELQEVITEEWSKGDSKSSLSSKLGKLYPFKPEDVARLESAPLVDAAVTRLAKHVTLPLDDAVSFKDPLDRKIDLDLKRIFVTAGAACKPVMALATMSKAMEVWVSDIESKLGSLSEEAVESSPIHELKLASVFLGEASIDVLRLLSRSMLSSVTAKRALWLRPWIADPASKQAWCKIPFEGTSLFGNKLDSAIAKATGGKSGFLPQDRRLFGQKKPQPRRQYTERSRDARSYKPNRDFRRNWRGGQSSTRRSSKNPAPAGQDSTKSF